MLKPDQLIAAMGALRDQLLALLRDHERTDHGGDVCMGNRVSAVAFLAHCVGVTCSLEGLVAFGESLKGYEDTCPDCQKRNGGSHNDEE